MESFKKIVADEDRAESTNRVGSHYRMQDIRSHTETDNFGEAFLSELTLWTFPCTRASQRSYYYAPSDWHWHCSSLDWTLWCVSVYCLPLSSQRAFPSSRLRAFSRPAVRLQIGCHQTWWRLVKFWSFDNTCTTCEAPWEHRGRRQKGGTPCMKGPSATRHSEWEKKFPEFASIR